MNRKELRNIIEEAFFEVLIEQNTVLQTGTQEVLGKFPTLKRNIVNLLTTQYEDFIQEIQWVAPKPTTFKVILKNDQIFFLKWMGKGFEAQIGGKRYYLPTLSDFQQALDKLGELMKYAPTPQQEEPGDLEEPSFEAEPEISGLEAEPETGGEEEVEFEEPGEEPEV